MQKSKHADGKLYAQISAVSVIVIVLLLNLIAQLFPLKLDFSEGRRYSIGNDTKTMLGTLERDVTVYGLFDEGKADRDYLEIRELLEAYERQSDGHISAEYIDPDRDTKIIARLDPEGLLGLRKNDFYITDGSRSKKLSYQDLFRMEYDQKTSTWFNTGSSAERAFTDAIGAVGEEEAATVYLVSDEPEAYGAFSAEAQKAGRTVKSLDPAFGEIPADAAVLLFLAPDEDLTEDAFRSLTGYMDGRGDLAVFFDAAENGEDFPRWNELLSKFSMKAENNHLAETDAERSIPDDAGALLLDVAASDVIPLEFYGLLLPGARSLRVLDGGQAKVTVLARTGDSVIDAGGTGGARVVAASSERGRAKLLLTGSAGFLRDETKESYPHYFVTGLYFAASALDWLAEKDSGSDIETKYFDRGELQIPRYKADYIGFLTVIVLPLAIFGRGFLVWRRRRYL